MIYFVTRFHAPAGVPRILAGLRRDLRTIRLISYEELFHTRKAPIGHYIFTHQDGLSTFECEIAVGIARSLQQADPNIRILNAPGQVLERVPLLRHLQKQGMNRYSVTRLDDGSRPESYPVFVRCEDYHLGTDTELLHTQGELEDALAELRTQGKVLKGRIAVEFCAKRTNNGHYRKYGAFNINGSIIPQHILDCDHWMVKSSGRHRSVASAAEELEYIRSNPHRDYLAEVFKIANIDYGRVDYGIVDGQLQIYEINTNPTTPTLHQENHADEMCSQLVELRRERRSFIRTAFLEALSDLDTPLQSGRPVRFSLPKHKHHELITHSPWYVRRSRLKLRRKLYIKMARLYGRLEERNPRLARIIPIRPMVRVLRRQ